MPTCTKGDDCISIVSNSSEIQIGNIAYGPGHGISIGSLGKSHSWSQVHNVLVDGVFMSNTENGVRIKAWQGGGGFVSKISFENVLMENVTNSIIIDQYYCDTSMCQSRIIEQFHRACQMLSNVVKLFFGKWAQDIHQPHLLLCISQYIMLAIAVMVALAHTEYKH